MLTEISERRVFEIQSGTDQHPNLGIAGGASRSPRRAWPGPIMAIVLWHGRRDWRATRVYLCLPMQGSRDQAYKSRRAQGSAEPPLGPAAGSLKDTRRILPLRAG